MYGEIYGDLRKPEKPAVHSEKATHNAK